MISKPSIVIIQTAFIGDLFLSLPTIGRLKIQFPEHQIILICKKGLSEIFLQENKIDLAFEIEKGESNSYQNVLKKLKNLKIDIVICLHQSFRSSLFSFRISAKNKIGFKNLFNQLFMTETVVYQKKWPDVIRQMNILSPIDPMIRSEINKKDWAYLNYKRSDGYFEKIPDLFSFKNTFDQSNLKIKNEPQIVAVFPGSVWKTKQWSVTGFSDVVKDLIRNNKSVLLMGGPSEKNICAEIQNLNPKAMNYSGQLSLYESFLQLKKCDLVICNDSAPAHMAASLGIQVISIFGPTTVSLGFRPWSDNARVVENLNIDCRPCGAHGHNKCPRGHHKCMIDIKSESVTELIQI